MNRGMRGLTMVELSTGLVVGTLVMALAYRVFLTFNAQAITQSRLSQRQNELGPIQEELERNLRRISFGIPMKVERRISASVKDTLQSVTLLDNGSSPDGLVVRGNFSGVSTQLRLACATGAAYLDLLTGTAAGFQGAAAVIVNDGEFNEYVTVSSVDAPNSRIATSARLRAYPMGAQVIRVSTIEFRPTADTLSIYTDGRRHKLSGSLSDLRFYFVLFNGTTDSLPPFNCDQVKFVQYKVKLRIPKPRNAGFLYREETSRVLLRNIQ